MFMGFAREQFRTRFSNAAAVKVWWKHLFRVVASQETKRDAVQKRSCRKSMAMSSKPTSGPEQFPSCVKYPESWPSASKIGGRFYISGTIGMFSASQLFCDTVCDRFAAAMTNRLSQFVAHSNGKQLVEGSNENAVRVHRFASANFPLAMPTLVR